MNEDEITGYHLDDESLAWYDLESSGLMVREWLVLPAPRSLVADLLALVHGLCRWRWSPIQRKKIPRQYCLQKHCHVTVAESVELMRGEDVLGRPT